MRSRTSQGVLEWSGGKELYMGSRVSAIGKVSGVTGIVPGPPDVGERSNFKKIPTHTQDHGDGIAMRGESVVYVPS